MNYDQVKRAVAVVRRSLEKESFEDFRDFFRALGDVEDAYGYEHLSDGKDDEDFLEEIMRTCNEFGYADHVEESKKQDSRKSLKEDAGKTIQKLDALVDDMTSAGVLDFADDICSAVNGAYQYGFEDREIREELYSVWTEMKHTRDPLVLDYADKLYDIVKPYIDEYLGTRFYDESTKQAYRKGYLRGLKEAEESEYAPLIASLRKIVGKPNAFFADQIEDLCKDGKFYAASRKVNVYSMQHIRLSPEKTQKLNDIHDALVQLSL